MDIYSWSETICGQCKRLPVSLLMTGSHTGSCALFYKNIVFLGRALFIKKNIFFWDMPFFMKFFIEKVPWNGRLPIVP